MALVLKGDGGAAKTIEKYQESVTQLAVSPPAASPCWRM
jgi:hypothetical protein